MTRLFARLHLFVALVALLAGSAFAQPVPPVRDYRSSGGRFEGDIKNLVPDAPLANAESLLPAQPGEVKTIDPKLVLFSQLTCSATFRDGRSVLDLIADLKAGRANVAEIPPLRVFLHNGAIWSLDNRRLYAFKEAGIPVRIVLASEAEIKKEAYKYSTKSGGRTIRLTGLDNQPGRTVDRTVDRTTGPGGGGLVERLPLAEELRRRALERGRRVVR